MKNRLLNISVFFCVACFISNVFIVREGYTVPAGPLIHTLLQGDGTEFLARQWGDEWSHGWETIDGYSIVFDEATQNWTYAVNDARGRLIPSPKLVLRDPLPYDLGKRARPTGDRKREILEKKATLFLEPAMKIAPSTGTANIPVILINFNDTTTTYSAADFDSLLFDSGNKSMKDYYEEVSYGAFSVSAGPAGVSGWYTAAEGHDYYGADDLPFKDIHCGELVIEAVAAADAAGFNFALYDHDGDCYVDVVSIIYQGFPQSLSGTSTDIWPHRSTLSVLELFGDGTGEYTTNDTAACGSIKVDGYTIQAETTIHVTSVDPPAAEIVQATIGTFAHEFGHVLGLPDLYDTDGSSMGVGAWGLMGGGSHNYVAGGGGGFVLGDTPAHLSAWSKYFMGWVSPTPVSGTLAAEPIEEAATSADVYQLLCVNKSVTGEYFLVENRQRTPGSFDEGLPGDGLAIWHVDESRQTNRSECCPPDSEDCTMDCTIDHYRVALVQADGNWDLEIAVNRGDDGDLYPGASGNTSFSASTVPDSRFYDGSESNVSVTSIGVSSPIMTATLSAPAECLTNLLANPGFESGYVAWTGYSSVGKPTIWEYPQLAHKGNYFAWVGYGENTTEWIYQDVTIPEDATEAYVHFWYWIYTDEPQSASAYDFLTVEIRRPSDNALLSTLTTLSNRDQTLGWVPSGRYNVLSFKGQTIRVRFHATNNSSNPTWFFVDDAESTVRTPSNEGVLSVSPDDGLSSAGTEGGPFSPSSKQYTLTNTGSGSLDWTAAKSKVWVTLSSTNGTLSAGETTDVTVTINSGAYSLSAGIHSDTLSFANSTNGNGDTNRPISLTVISEFVNLLANPGFEDGPTDWTEDSSGDSDIIREDPSVAHDGSWYAELGGYDGAIDDFYQDVTIPCSVSEAYVQFWYWIETDELTTLFPYDVMDVEIRNPDDALLETLMILSNLDKGPGWVQSEKFDILAYKDQTIRVRFHAENDSSFPTSFRVDDVKVEIVPGICTVEKNKKEVMVDFGDPYGLYVRYNDTTWSKLHPASPEFVAVGDMDGYEDEAIIDFGSSGIWVRYNDTSWVKLHATNPEFIATGNMDDDDLDRDEVIIDFGISGVWVRYNDTSWVKLHPSSPDSIAIGDMDGNGKDDVIFDFGASGIWVRYNDTSWVKLHPSNPDGFVTGDMDGNGQDEVIIDFGSSGIWVRMNNSSWSKLHPSNPDAITTGNMDGDVAGKDEVIIDFGSSGIWVRKNNSSWSKLHPSNPDGITTGNMDGDNPGRDEVIIDFPGSGMWVRYNDTSWTKLHSMNCEQMATGNIDGY